MYPPIRGSRFDSRSLREEEGKPVDYVVRTVTVPAAFSRNHSSFTTLPQSFRHEASCGVARPFSPPQFFFFVFFSLWDAGPRVRRPRPQRRPLRLFHFLPSRRVVTTWGQDRTCPVGHLPHRVRHQDDNNQRPKSPTETIIRLHRQEAAASAASRFSSSSAAAFAAATRRALDPRQRRSIPPGRDDAEGDVAASGSGAAAGVDV